MSFKKGGKGLTDVPAERVLSIFNNLLTNSLYEKILD